MRSIIFVIETIDSELSKPQARNVERNQMTIKIEKIAKELKIQISVTREIPKYITHKKTLKIREKKIRYLSIYVCWIFIFWLTWFTVKAVCISWEYKKHRIIFCHFSASIFASVIFLKTFTSRTTVFAAFFTSCEVNEKKYTIKPSAFKVLKVV